MDAHKWPRKGCLQPTYEELKRYVHLAVGSHGAGLQPTYEELKPKN